MTEDSMALVELAEKHAGEDFLRDGMIRASAYFAFSAAGVTIWLTGE